MVATSTHKEFFKSRRGKLFQAVLTLILAYLMFLKATDTGSWGQYFLLAGLLFLGLNRLLRAVYPRKNNK